MAVRIERTNGLVLMSPEELHAAVAQKEGEIVIRLSADALHRPGAFFHILSDNREEASVPVAPGPAPLPPGVQQNTSPTFPPVPDDGTSPMAGIETPATTDNLQGEIA